MLTRSGFAVVVTAGALGLSSCGSTDTASNDSSGGVSGSARAKGGTSGGGPTPGSAGTSGAARGGSESEGESPASNGGVDVSTSGGGGRATDPGEGGAGASKGEASGGQDGGDAGMGGGGGSGETGGNGSTTRVCTFTADQVNVAVQGACNTATQGVTVDVGGARATLENSVIPAGPVVAIGSVGAAHVSLRITPDTSAPASELLAVRIQSNGSIAPLAHDVDGSNAVIDVRRDGSYAIVRVAPAPLPNCGTEVVTGNHSASANSELSALRNVSFLAGSLSILGGVTDLDALSCLRSIGGDLVIGDTTALANSAALANLVRIGGKLAVSDNTGLTSVALPNLLLLNAELRVERNGALTELALPRIPQIFAGPLRSSVYVYRNGAAAGSGLSLDFGALQVIRGLVDLDENAGLVDLGFGALTRTDGGVYVTQNPRLTEILLPAYEKATRWIQFRENGALTTIELENLASLGDPEQGDNFYISNNPALGSVKLSKLKALDVHFRFASNGAARTSAMAADFGALRKVRQLSISNNPGLENFDGWSALEEVDDLELHGNVGLTRFELPNIQALRRLDARSNDALETIDLGGLTTLDYFRIEENLALAAIEASAVQEVGSHLILRNNGVDAASTTYDFSELETVGDDLTLYGNPGLENLDGFAKLERIEGFFFLSVNARLTNTNGLAALEHVEYDLVVYDNDELTSLNLPSLTYLGRNLLIVENGKLSNCVATQLRDRLPAVEGRVREANLTANLPDPSCPEDPAPPAL